MNRSTVTNNRTIFFRSMVVVLIVLGFASISYAKKGAYEMPLTINSSVKYLFFLHNFYVEQHGPDGACKYYDILQAIADKGFTVISEVRSEKINPLEYAKKIVSQVKILFDAGVPPKNITIAGHSKGGVIALCVASQLGNSSVAFVVMAGCEIKPLEKFYPDFTKLKGNFLSIYASSDSIARSCKTAFSKTTQSISSTEMALESDKGHKLFFQPEGIWLDPVISWLKKKQ